MSNNSYITTGATGGISYNTTTGLLPNPVPAMTDFGNFHCSTLLFKLFKAQNGFILEVGPDRSYADIANGMQSPKRDLYIIDDIQNMGERITQILSLHLLSKD